MDETLEQLLLSPLVYFLFDSTKLALESPRFPRNATTTYTGEISCKNLFRVLSAINKRSSLMAKEFTQKSLVPLQRKPDSFSHALFEQPLSSFLPPLSLSPCSTTINYSSGCRTGGLYHPWIRPRLLLEVGKGLERKGVGRRRIERSGEWQR